MSVFQLQCSACHGADGKRKSTDENLRFTSPTVQSGLSAAELLLPINNGGSGTAMPSWVGKLSVGENFEVAGRLFMPASYLSSAMPPLLGHTFSIGIGETFDDRPTVSLLAEVIPTTVNGEPLGIHRPAYASGVQKKIWRDAFSFGFMNGPLVLSPSARHPRCLPKRRER